VAAGFFHVRSSNPFEQAFMRDELAVERANNRVRHQTGLMGHERERKGELSRVNADVFPNAPKVTGPGNTSRVGHHAGGHMEIDRKGHRDQYEETPQKRRTWEDGP